MSVICPNCTRSITDAAGAAFCMFCGFRLRGSSADPDATTDQITKSFAGVAEPTPLGTRPERVGSYQLVRPLGEGGMGSVFEAVSDDSGERVAIKLLSPKLAANPVSVERFKQEGRLASQISHPRCVFVYGADTDAGRPFIVMELMPGTTLKDVIDRDGPLAPDLAVVRILDVIDGLIEAHRLGVIHRDVKPSNCFLTIDGRVKVGDFGLSKSLDGAADGQLTATGAFLGTVLFASPEQIRGEEVGYDSDVYSVCGTLYFLLAGRAPYQHESVTAALARAISEPPPRLRSVCPAATKALERVVMRGLERDRDRRVGTLEDLRDALAELLPAKQTPARPRVAFAAFLIDLLLIFALVQLPLALVAAAVTGSMAVGFGTDIPVAVELIDLGLMVAYFALAEGLLGYSVGKWALRLRVSRLAAAGPPGLRAAAIRAAVFAGMFALVFYVPEWVSDWLGAVAFVAGVWLLCRQLRRSHGYRGWHDEASGCRVTQRPRPPARVRLVSKHPNPLDRPASVRGLPDAVAGFVVRGALPDPPAGEAVWVAEDRSLNRRILVWLRPADCVCEDEPEPPVRPTRLRAVGTGELVRDGRKYCWTAFVAPTGAPLADIASPARPLPWADARVVLEQVVDELRAAAADGTLPGRFGVDQLWVEPGGRLHLLPFPVPAATGPVEPTNGPARLVRQVATLCLEGTPRADDAPVRAPLPAHTGAVFAALFDRRADGVSLDDVRKELADSHAHPPRVTGGMRAAHVGLTGILAAVVLVPLVLATLTLPWRQARTAANRAVAAERARDALADPARAAELRTSPGLADALAADRLPAAAGGMAAFARDERAAADAVRDRLTRPERAALDRAVRFDAARREPADGVTADEVSEALVQMGLASASPAGRRAGDDTSEGIGLLILAPLVFAAFAVAFRGGLAFVLAGVAIVRRDGSPAGRFRCGLRELLAWLPLVGVLGLALWVSAAAPQWVLARVVLTVASVGTLVAYAVVGVRSPDRGPVDRVVGTYLVPR